MSYTKLYLVNSIPSGSGLTYPSTKQASNALTANADAGQQGRRSLSTSKGAGAFSSTASTSGFGAGSYWMDTFCTPQLGAQTVSGSMTLSIGWGQGGGASASGKLGLYVYAWRPSTGTKVAELYGTAGAYTLTSNVASNDGNVRSFVATLALSSATLQTGDIICVEVWGVKTEVSQNVIQWGGSGTEYSSSGSIISSANDPAAYVSFSVPLYATGESAEATPRAEHMRVQVKDASGTWRDLTSYPGFNAVDSASWKKSVDDFCATADVVLGREVDNLSIAPLMTSSAPNLAFNPAGTYSALLDLGREIKIETAIVPMDHSPTSADWVVSFHGRIDTIDPGGDSQIKVGCRDLGGKLQDTFIETEYVYSFGVVGGSQVSCQLWQPTTAVALNAYYIPSQSKLNGYVYKCTTAGTTGSTEPTWPSAGTVADGSVVWTQVGTTTSSGRPVEEVLQQILNDNLGAGAVTLYTPSSPGWNIKQFIQKREPVADALRNLAQQIGWDIRYKYRSATSQYELTFYQPNRTKTVADAIYGPKDYTAVDKVALDIQGIRNAVRVIYSDSTDKDPTGWPKRKTITVTDSTSIARYGRRFMEIAEESASQIDTSTEATSMANACLADLKDPVLEQSVTLAYGAPSAELGDLYLFVANGRHYSSDQTLAVFSVSHDATEGHIVTTLECRGKPSGGYLRWLEICAHPAAKRETHQLTTLDVGSAPIVAATPIVGGLRLAVSHDELVTSKLAAYEYHLGSVANYVPSAATLAAVSETGSVDITSLTPGATYYAKVVPVSLNDGEIIRGQPTAEVSAVAGYLQPLHAQPLVSFGAIPPNGNFEATNLAGSPPDGWTVNGSAAWGTDILSDSSTVYSGSKSVKLATTCPNNAGLASQFFTVIEGERYAVNAWSWQDTSWAVGHRVTVTLQWYSDLSTFISGNTLQVPVGAATSAWTRLYSVVSPPSGAKYARILINKDASLSGAFTAYVDSVRVVLATTQLPDWTAPTLLNSWANAGGTSTGYMLDGSGFVVLRGRVDTGAAPSIAFTLPSGYRPDQTQRFICACGTSLGICTVDTAGNVEIDTFPGADFSFDGIRFRPA